MPIVKEVTVFQFDELGESAKERARQWFLEGFEFDSECALESIATAAKILGIEIETRTAHLMGGGTRQEPAIHFEVGSQGEGISFDAGYSYAPGSRKAIRAEFGDTELHGIADALASAQKPEFYWMAARLVGSHRYHSTRVHEVERNGRDRDPAERNAEALESALDDFTSWAFAQIKADYEDQMSDESVDESIRMNEYEFDERGSRAY